MSIQQILGRVYHRSMKYKMIDLDYAEIKEEFLNCVIFKDVKNAINHFNTKWSGTI